MYCKDCECWTKNVFEERYAVDAYHTNYYKIKTKFGKCSSSNIVNGDGGNLEYTDKKTDQLIYDDMEGLARLETGENFSCVHFKEKDITPVTVKGKWIEATKEEGLEALRKGEYVLVVYVDGTHSLLETNIKNMLKSLYPGDDPKEVMNKIVKFPERKDLIRGVIEIENVYVWKE